MRATLSCLLITCALALPCQAQWIYLSDVPESCRPTYTEGAAPLYIYASSGPATTTGAFFRFQGVDAWWGGSIEPEDIILMTPAPGVTIVGGDLITGMTLAWPPQQLDHAVVLTLDVGPGLFGAITSKDIIFLTSGGTFPGEDTISLVEYSYPHCGSTQAKWQAPDTVDVTISRTSTFAIKANLTTESSIGGYAHVVDPDGWVTGISSHNIPPACWDCPWDWEVIDVTVFVPEGVAPYTLNTITLWAEHVVGNAGEVDIVLRAIEPVATEPTSMGRLKALFLKKAE